MTPCPEGFPCDPVCIPPCPPGKVCLQIAPGFYDGYCTWEGVRAVTDISCESETTNCCCKCAEIPDQPDCEFFTIDYQDPEVDGCDGAKYMCEGYNTDLVANATECCNMYKPPSGSVMTKDCQLAGALCVPCNRVQKVRTTDVPICNGIPLGPPYSEYFAPCYTSRNGDGSMNKCAPLDSSNWSEVRFNVGGYNSCSEQQKCTGNCFVYSQCNDDPETQVDLCMFKMGGIYCFPLISPGSPCATPDPQTQTCEDNYSCEPCQYGPPTMIYGEVSCTGVDPIPYCTYTCQPGPCEGVVCPEGYYCNPETGICDPFPV